MKTTIIIKGRLATVGAIGNQKFEKRKPMEKRRNIDPAGAYVV